MSLVNNTVSLHPLVFPSSWTWQTKTCTTGFALHLTLTWFWVWEYKKWFPKDSFIYLISFFGAAPMKARVPVAEQWGLTEPSYLFHAKTPHGPPANQHIKHLRFQPNSLQQATHGFKTNNKPACFLSPLPKISPWYREKTWEHKIHLGHGTGLLLQNLNCAWGGWGDTSDIWGSIETHQILHS